MSQGPVPTDPFQRAAAALPDLVSGLGDWGSNAEETELVEAIRSSVRSFGQREIDGAAIERDHKIPRALLDQAAELGLFGLTIPEEHGGSGLSLQGSCGVIAQLAEFDRSFATSIGLHNGLGLRGLIRYGSPELKQRYLPDLAAGRKIAAFAATEAGAGSDLAAIRARATPDPDKPDSLLLDGSKLYITNAGFADLFTTVMYTPGLGGKKKGHSLVLVPRQTEGFTIGREEDKLGLRGSSTAALYFENASVPADHVIGEPGKGIVLMNRILAWGRTLMAAGCLGGAHFALSLAASHVQNRRQFGRALAEFELVRHQIAAMRAKIFLAESLARLAARMCDAVDEVAGWETAAAKILCSEQAFSVIDSSLQLHGGSGFIEETGVARALRDCRVTRIFEGANDVLRLHLATDALTWPLARIEEIPPLASQVAPVLRESAELYDRDMATLLAQIAALRTAHGMRAIERQARLSEIGAMALVQYATLAVILRTEGIVARSGSGAPEVDLALCVCPAARSSFASALAALHDDTGASSERVAQREFERCGPR
jgi:alkylation response protein AidB-like acyl-CoA dehydrogenase